jgi:hypothetical protein
VRHEHRQESFALRRIRNGKRTDCVSRDAAQRERRFAFEYPAGDTLFRVEPDARAGIERVDCSAVAGDISVRISILCPDRLIIPAPAAGC